MDTRDTRKTFQCTVLVSLERRNIVWNRAAQRMPRPTRKACRESGPMHVLGRMDGGDAKTLPHKHDPDNRISVLNLDANNQARNPHKCVAYNLSIIGEDTNGLDGWWRNGR